LVLADWSEVDPVASTNEVLAALPETIVQVDDDFRLTTVNRPESPIFQRKALAGDPLEEILEGEAFGMITGLIHNAQRIGGAIAEYHTGADLFRVTAKPLLSAPLTLLIFQNITGLRHAGRALVELVRDKSSFLTSLSNELRTPLTAVLGYANLLVEPDPGLDEAARRRMVQDMTDQAWDLAGIVEDLLTVARAEIGELDVASVPVNIPANVAQIIESMGGRGSRISVTGDRTVTGVGDPAGFRQVVRNLLSNALTHGSEPVTVEVTADETHAVLRVKDRGMGVPEGLAESMFNQYVTANDSETPGRVGIGLWISRELTTLMGGQLTYHREENRTVFQVTLPLLGHTESPGGEHAFDHAGGAVRDR
jgi:signal transduction histidine kinase